MFGQTNYRPRRSTAVIDWRAWPVVSDQEARIVRCFAGNAGGEFRNRRWSNCVFHSAKRNEATPHVGNGFRAPSLFERFGDGFINSRLIRFGDPTLRAEQSISADGGFDQRLGNDRVMFGATYFYTRLQRVIAFAGFRSRSTRSRTWQWFRQSSRWAFGCGNPSLNASPVKEMDPSASYTFTNSDRALVFQGLQPEYVIPKHLPGSHGSNAIDRFCSVSTLIGPDRISRLFLRRTFRFARLS